MTKKSLYLSVGILIMIVTTATAQFGKGDKLWNLGVGLNSAYNGGLPLHTSLEFGINDVISLGGNIDFLSHRYTAGSIKYGFTAFYTGFRVSYHFNKLFKLNIDELDIYGGGSIGYRTFAWRDDNSLTNTGNAYGSGIYAGAHVGARWYFKPAFGVFLEVGAGGSSNGRGGIVLRF
jgi:hypothetical protein